MKTKIRINLCASPRNISTALMYAFGNRKDMTVLDEPLYASYLSKNNVEHPGKNEILKSMSNNADEVIQTLTQKDFETPYAFFKNMTHHYSELTDKQLDLLFSKTTNIILVRDPYEMIRSFAKVIPNPTLVDLGIGQQLSLIKRLKKTATLACVVDSNNVLKDPKKQLQIICEKCEIPFDNAMLNWKAGTRKEDGVWAKYWYSNVHKSTGFKPYVFSQEKIPQHLKALYNECMQYYEEIKSHCI